MGDVFFPETTIPHERYWLKLRHVSRSPLFSVAVCECQLSNYDAITTAKHLPFKTDKQTKMEVKESPKKVHLSPCELSGRCASPVSQSDGDIAPLCPQPQDTGYCQHLCVSLRWWQGICWVWGYYSLSGKICLVPEFSTPLSRKLSKGPFPVKCSLLFT